MKYPLIIFLVSLGGIIKAQTTTTNLIIEPKSTFILSGVSNVNEFDCKIVEGLCGQQLDVCYAQIDNSIIFNNTRFRLDVQKFDCNSSYITRDMKKTLKSEKYPFMYFELISISNLFGDGQNKESLAETLITISGQTNKYFLTYQFEPIDSDTYSVHINSDFDMKEFGILPPTALMGFIKTEETINVDLNLIISTK
jgi:hypothetical protein